MLFSNEENEIYIQDYTATLEKSYQAFLGELSSIRAGRANAKLLDKLMVEYYGTNTPVNQIANIMCPDPRTIVVAPWDVNAVKDIVKAIHASDLGLNPSEDGKVVRLTLPILTEERRKEITKQVGKLNEEYKVSMRNARRDCLEVYRKLKKDGDVTEPEMEIAEKEVQKILDNYTQKLDQATTAKEKEIMEI